jgi:hypothetical protein
VAFSAEGREVQTMVSHPFASFRLRSGAGGAPPAPVDARWRSFKMQSTRRWALAAVAGALLVAPSAAQELFVYPEQGQTPEQQRKDEMECRSWAQQQTGFDPARMHTASTPPPQGGPSVVGSAAGGAAVGAVVGKITGVGGGKGAGAGAAAGGMIAGMRGVQAQRQQDQWAQREAEQHMAKRHAYNRALSACLGGRGYTVQ